MQDPLGIIVLLMSHGIGVVVNNSVVVLATRLEEVDEGVVVDVDVQVVEV